MTKFQAEDLSHALAKAQALSTRIAAVNEIAIAINRSLNLDEILQTVGRQAKWLLDFDYLSVYLCNSESCRLITLFGADDIDQGAIAATHPILRALKAGQPQLIRDHSECFSSSHASGLVVPLENQRQMLGTINFASTRPNAYTVDDLRIGYLLALQLASTIRNAERFEELNHLNALLEDEKRKTNQLLRNILPLEIADELKQSGKVKPVHYQSASVLFTDFTDFTHLSEHLPPEELVAELDDCFSYFDQIVEKYNLEKLKTIGDSYMCVGGIPTPNKTHAVDAVLAALEMQLFMQLRKESKARRHQPYWDIRIGIHSGPLLAGVIGHKKFAYDVWGNTVNTASRMESDGIPGSVNISRDTFEQVKDFFNFRYRGKIASKNKGVIDMYLVTCIKEKLSIDPGGLLPNDNFFELYLKRYPDGAIATTTYSWLTSFLENLK